MAYLMVLSLVDVCDVPISLCCKLYGMKCVVTFKMADGLLRERWVSLFIINNFFFLKTLSHDTYNILLGNDMVSLGALQQRASAIIRYVISE